MISHRIAREPDCRGAVKRGLTVLKIWESYIGDTGSHTSNTDLASLEWLAHRNVQ